MKLEPIIIPCATEAEWHAERAKAIGASEAAALVGCHPYLTALQLWTRKKDNLGDTVQDSERLQAGRYAELMAAPWYAKRTGRSVVTPQEFYAELVPDMSSSVDEAARNLQEFQRRRDAFAIIVRHPTLPLQCTPDRIVFGPDFPIQGFTHGGRQVEDRMGSAPGDLQLKNADRWLLDQWEDEDGEPQAPLAYQVQTAVEMLCTGFTWGSLAAVVGGNRLRWVDMQRHEEFLTKIGEAARRFWHTLTCDIGPAASAGDLDDVRGRFPEHAPGLSCEYPQPEDVIELARVKAQLSRLEKQEAALMAKIGGLAGPAELLEYHGKKLATWKTRDVNDQPREARTRRVRYFLIDNAIKKAAEAALPAHDTLAAPILPAH